MTAFFVENVNLVLVLVGFAALEAGVAMQWSRPIAAMVGGLVLMAGGAWPYLVRTLRKRA